MGRGQQRRSGSGGGSGASAQGGGGGSEMEQPAGNAAAQELMRFIEHGIEESDVELSGGEPRHHGRVTASDAGAGRVLVVAPEIHFEASASLLDEVELPSDAFVQFGLTQTLLGSDRQLVYEQGGEEVFRQRMTNDECRDAVFVTREGQGVVSRAAEPFYDVPTNLTQVRRHATTSTQDQPGFDTPARRGNARLARVEGSDRFLSGWAVKRDGQVAQLGSYSWAVPWEVEIDEDLNGTGSQLSHEASEQDPSTLSGEIAVNSPEEWIEIPSVEAALRLPTDMLFQAIEQATGRDEEVAANAREALTRRDPTLTVELLVENTAEYFSADDIALTVTGSGSVTSPVQSLNDGETGTFTFRFSQLLDAGRVGVGTQLTISARDTGWVSNDPATLELAFPFDAQETPMVSADDVSYKVSAVWSD